MIKWMLVAAVALATAACAKTNDPAQPEAKAPATTVKSAPASKAPASKAPATTAIKKTAAKKPAGHHTRGTPIDFSGLVEWKDWAAGMAAAKASNTPVMLLIYADWCPKCQALKPAFKDAEFAELSKKLVMIKQNSDLKPEWLKQFAEFGGYVPRVLFLKPDGTVMRELTGPNRRYPHFFPIQALPALKDAMRKAAAG